MQPLQSSLLAKLAQVPDIRCKHGQVFAWSYLLAILTAGLAAGQTTILDLADWGATACGRTDRSATTQVPA
jgi:hypothetical protein